MSDGDWGDWSRPELVEDGRVGSYQPDARLAVVVNDQLPSTDEIEPMPLARRTNPNLNGPELIAYVIGRLRAGELDYGNPDKTLTRMALAQIHDPVVVDCTAIYNSIAGGPPVNIYEDHPCVAPPWEESFICYVNEHRNCMAIHLLQLDVTDEGIRWQRMWAQHDIQPSEPIDWSRVRWVIEGTLWLGGYSKDEWLGIQGPAHEWHIAIYEDGQPADIGWTQIVSRYPIDRWNTAMCVMLHALNFMNCRNTELVEPARPRAQRRRMERTAPGLHITEINVRPVGKHYAGGRGEGLGMLPLSSVRGHFSHYGDCCPGRHPPRGKLFGKLEGRYWIPQHARGSADAGETKAGYTLVPDG